MRVTIPIIIAVLLAGTAFAQNNSSEIVVPPEPPVTPEAPSLPAPTQSVSPLPAPIVVQSNQPAGTDNPAPAPANLPSAVAAPQLAPVDAAPMFPNNWSSGTTALVGVLNEVDGSTAQLTLPVGGQPQKVGDLSVSVEACDVRPPGQLPDIAVFLTVSPTIDTQPPLYRGWMLRSAPGATSVGNAGQTFRVIGCS